MLNTPTAKRYDSMCGYHPLRIGFEIHARPMQEAMSRNSNSSISHREDSDVFVAATSKKRKIGGNRQIVRIGRLGRPHVFSV